MNKTTKTYKLSYDYSIKCVTSINNLGEKKYSVQVVVDSLPWEEEVESVKNLRDPNEANRVFLELKAKYTGARLIDSFIK